MAAHHVAKRKVWAGLVLLVLGAAMVIAAPAGAQSDSSGNLTCEDVIGELGLTDVVSAKDDNQREAPFPAEGYFTFTENGLTVSYRLVAAPEEAPEPYVLEFKDASAPIFGVFVKQAADKQGLSRSGVFPEGTTSGSLWVPDGEFSHVSFCTGTVPTTAPPTSDEVPPTSDEVPPPTNEVDDDEVTTTTAEVTTSTAAPAAAQQPEAAVLGDVLVRELPRTGAGTGVMAVVGVGMILLGGYLVGHNSHRLVKHMDAVGG